MRSEGAFAYATALQIKAKRESLPGKSQGK